MKIKAQSAELIRMMKIIGKCLDQKNSLKANIQITHEDNRLKIRASNGTLTGTVSMMLLGGDGETFCIDGRIFTKVIGLCSGEVEISTDEKNCIVKGAGRTRIPIVNNSVMEHEMIEGKTVEMLADDFKCCYSRVAYAVAVDQSRMQLTGVFAETDGDLMRMVALDGFQMAIESMKCAGEGISAIIPGAFMDWVSASVLDGMHLKLMMNEKQIQAETDDMVLSSGLLAGQYIDYRRILPDTFSTEILVKVGTARNALKSGIIIGNKQQLVKVSISDSELTISSNSEEADFESNIPCDMRGEPLQIAFNDKYLMNTLNAIDGDEAVMKFNTQTSPVIVQAKGHDGIHLCLPVRIAG